jgi:hypothetical protein
MMKRKTGARPSRRFLVTVFIAVFISGIALTIVGLLVTRKDAGETLAFVQSGTPTSKPAPPVWTPIPQPPRPPLASEFVDGQNEMPPDKYLFVEYWSDSKGISTSGRCKDATMIDYPTYSYHSGSLSAFGTNMRRGMRNTGSSLVGFLGCGRSLNGAMGGGISSEIHVIEELPYIMLTPGQYEIGIIHSVDAQGGVVVTIDNSTYLLEPGRKWARIIESDPDPNCHLVSRISLTNYGLLDKSQVTTASDDYLKRLQRNGTTYAPHQLVWAADGETLIFATRKGIRFYSTSPLSPTKHWETLTPVLGIAISPDGGTLAAANADGSIQLWDIASNQLIGEPMSDPPGPWLSLAFSPSGEILATGSYDGIIQLWDAETRQAIGSPWANQMYAVWGLEFSS